VEATVRTARPGDICILLEPAQDGTSFLHERQLALQALFGGRPHETVHLTCQRFDARGQTESHIIQRLRTAFAAIRPFPIIAASLVQFYSPFWETHLLRWSIQNTTAFQRCRTVIQSTLTELGITAHYPPERVPLVTALEDIPAVSLDDHLRGMVFPHQLFIARQVVLSRIKGPREFDVLDRLTL
jgi:hypothetical protein